MNKQLRRHRKRKFNLWCHGCWRIIMRMENAEVWCVLAQKYDNINIESLHKKWTNHRFLHEKVGVKQHWFDTTLEKVGRGKLAPWFRASAVYYRITFLSVILPVTILGLIELKIALHLIGRSWKSFPKTKHEVDRIRSYHWKQQWLFSIGLRCPCDNCPISIFRPQFAIECLRRSIQQRGG